MKTCNLYIFSLEDEHHRTIVREALQAIRAIKLESGELYIPRTFIFDDVTEELLLEAISECKYGRPDIIVSVGVSITTCLSQLYKKIEPINTIFMGVYDPVGRGIIDSFERPGGSMSGVRWDMPQSYDLVRKTFEPLGPVMKKIFMPYDTRLSQPDFCIKAIVTNIGSFKD